jgi:hypothetical protein
MCGFGLHGVRRRRRSIRSSLKLRQRRGQASDHTRHDVGVFPHCSGHARAQTWNSFRLPPNATMAQDSSGQSSCPGPICIGDIGFGRGGERGTHNGAAHYFGMEERVKSYFLVRGLVSMGVTPAPRPRRSLPRRRPGARPSHGTLGGLPHSGASHDATQYCRTQRCKDRPQNQ